MVRAEQYLKHRKPERSKKKPTKQRSRMNEKQKPKSKIEKSEKLELHFILFTLFWFIMIVMLLHNENIISYFILACLCIAAAIWPAECTHTGTVRATVTTVDLMQSLEQRINPPLNGVVKQ